MKFLSPKDFVNFPTAREYECIERKHLFEKLNPQPYIEYTKAHERGVIIRPYKGTFFECVFCPFRTCLPLVKRI